jgi:hypothetical protein
VVVVNRLELQLLVGCDPRSAVVGGCGISSFHFFADSNDDMVSWCSVRATGRCIVRHSDINVLVNFAASRNYLWKAVFPRFIEHEALSILSPRGLDKRNMAYCAYTLASLLFLPLIHT